MGFIENTPKVVRLAFECRLPGGLGVIYLNRKHPDSAWWCSLQPTIGGFIAGNTVLPPVEAALQTALAGTEKVAAAIREEMAAFGVANDETVPPEEPANA